MRFITRTVEIFERAIFDYHINDNIDSSINNPFPDNTIDNCLYRKAWIDTVQWHFEDLIRDPQIDPAAALVLKRRIDNSNQERTDLVEQIDDYFLNQYKDVKPSPDATINTESPAWAVDRLSILCLKIYHMKIEAERMDVCAAHHEKCARKLAVLLEQKDDLSTAIEQLLQAIQSGEKYMKVYRQMKMYNDPNTNPILYSKR